MLRLWYNVQELGNKFMYDKLFLALMGASAAHAEASRAVFAELGLTAGQPKILYILRRGDGLVQKRLAYLCDVTQPTLTGVLAGMEKKGLVRRERAAAEGCRTAVRVFLTEKGREMAGLLEGRVEELEERGFAGFSPGERAEILETLCKITENIRKK